MSGRSLILMLAALAALNMLVGLVPVIGWLSAFNLSAALFLFTLAIKTDLR